MSEDFSDRPLPRRRAGHHLLSRQALDGTLNLVRRGLLNPQRVLIPRVLQDAFRILCRCLLHGCVDSSDADWSLILDVAYLPAQQACRFPINAEMPSWASAASEFMLITSWA